MKNDLTGQQDNNCLEYFPPRSGFEEVSVLILYRLP